MTTEPFTVTATVSYRPYRVPPRCRKARREDCEDWPAIPRSRSLTFATLEGLDFDRGTTTCSGSAMTCPEPRRVATASATARPTSVCPSPATRSPTRTTPARTEGAVREKIDAAAKRDQAAQKKRDEHADQIKNIRKDLPDWAVDIVLSDDGMPDRHEQLVLTVTEEASKLRFRDRSPGTFSNGRESLTDVIRNHELVEQCYWAEGPNSIGILPLLDGDQLIAVFRDADSEVREQLDIDTRRKVGQDEAIQAAKVSIAAKLAEL